MPYHCFPSVAHSIPDKYVVKWASQSSNCWQVPSRQRVTGKFTKLVDQNKGGDHRTDVEEERGITQSQNKSAGSVRIGARIKIALVFEKTIQAGSRGRKKARLKEQILRSKIDDE